MSIRFAGSRFVHERRRRRIAQECGGVAVVPVDNDSAPVSDDETAQPVDATVPSHSPVISIIRPQLWIHWMITVLCGATWGGMLYVGDLAEQADFGLKDILGIRSGRVTTFFSTIMLLWAGQLALLIYWYRRKSRNDFAGRYRMWLWIGAMLQFFLVVVATSAHHPYSEYMQQVWPAKIPRYDLLSWLVPVSTLALAMYRLLRIELKRHRSGRILLNLAAVAAVVAASSLVLGPLLSERARDLSQIGAATLAQMALATALLMHARYVVHVSNEVPRRQRSSMQPKAAIRSLAGMLNISTVGRLKLPRLRMPGISLPRLRFPQVKLSRVKQSRKVQDDSPQSKEQAPGQSSRTTTITAAARPEPNPSQSSREVETRSESGSRKGKRQKPRSGEQRRIDPAHTSRVPRRGDQSRTQTLDDILDKFGADGEIDAEALRGLSKKQRRRLRKKQRELQRTAS